MTADRRAEAPGGTQEEDPLCLPGSDPVRRPSANLDPGRPLRVLVVDDEPVDGMRVRRALDKAGEREVRLDMCEDGEDVVTRIKEDRYDAIFLDHELGLLTGLDVLERIEPIRGRIAIIFLTGHGDERLAALAMRRGADDYLAKDSLTPDLLARSLRGAVARRRLGWHAHLERRRRERAHERLARRHEEVRAFYHVVAHELRTPLTGAREFLAHVLEERPGPINPAQRQALELVREGLETIRMTVDDLVEAARLETGKFRLTRRSLEPAPLFRRTVEAFRTTAAERGVALEDEIPESLPRIEGDGPRLAQVLRNLIDNALKATPRDGTVTVRAAAKRGRLVVSVHDTGRGLEPEEIAHVFDRHWQVRDHDAAIGGGLGLGLAIGREIARLHEGGLDCRSTPGAGAVFTMRLPLESEGLSPAP